MVALLLTSVLMVVGYRMLTTSSQSGRHVLRQSRVNERVEKTLDQMNTQITNAFALSMGGPPLRYNALPLACGNQAPASSLVAFPGFQKSNFNEALAVFDPRSRSLENAPADAIRIASVANNSLPAWLYVDPSTGLPEDTHGPSRRIRLASVADYQQFQPGDFFILTDKLGSVFGRVTRKSVSGSRYYLHHDDRSVWNQLAEMRHFGKTENDQRLEGGAMVQKAQVVTYAFGFNTPDPSAGNSGESAGGLDAGGTLWMNDHLLDDGFNPVSQNFGQAGERHQWIPLIRDIQGFVIEYRVADGSGEGTYTRTPQSGQVNTTLVSCQSQLAPPVLQHIRLTLAHAQKSTERLSAPRQMRLFLNTAGVPVVQVAEVSPTPDTPVTPVFPDPPTGGAPTPTPGPSPTGGTPSGSCGISYTIGRTAACNSIGCGNGQRIYFEYFKAATPDCPEYSGVLDYPCNIPNPFGNAGDTRPATSVTTNTYCN